MKKYKVGYTTGVFDLFHIGHLNILKKSKEMCDYLIVGVSTDELVQKYKSKTPVIPFEERIKIINAIKYVDKVVPQITMDKIEAWKELHFDVMFHGNDWNGSDLYLEIEKKFHEKGIDLIFLPHTDGTSSTIISNKIRGIENAENRR